jgi:hypothetical protein
MGSHGYFSFHQNRVCHGTPFFQVDSNLCDTAMIPLTIAEEILTTILDYLATTFNFQDETVDWDDDDRVVWMFFEGLKAC